jgi:hypothetical protein
MNIFIKSLFKMSFGRYGSKNNNLSYMNKFKSTQTVLILLFVFLILDLSAQTFVHPGMLHKDSDFDRMKAKVSASAQPWKGGWDMMVANSHSASTYSLQGPVDTVYRGYDGVHPENYGMFFNDIAAAYANAIRWKVGGTVANADKAVQILNAWAGKLKALKGTGDAYLAAGIYGYEIANAAEIMRSYSGWTATDFATFRNMMLTVFYPLNHDFLVRHNNACITNYWANWDLCSMASMISIGILCDNATIFNEAVTYYKSGVGNGQLAKVVNYLYAGDIGQWQESGRDQGHCLLGPALIGPFCEMAWNQGLDLYGYDNNRLWKGCEYVAKYNLGNAVPFTAYNNCNNVNQLVNSPTGRGSLRPVFELIYNHYVNRKGFYSPYIQMYAAQCRPEGGGGNYGSTSGGFDQLGYGTLTFSLESPIKKGQIITFPALSAMVVGDTDKDPGATASSGIRVTYQSATPDIAEIVNNKIHALKCGTATIKAYQVGDSVYNEATAVSQNITITNPTPVVAGTNNIYISSTGMAMDVSGNSLLDGGAIIQWNGNGGTNQQWLISSMSGNDYKIIDVNSGKALDVIGNSNTAGAKLEQRAYTGEAYQIWTITDNCDGTYKIVNTGNGLALGVTGSSTTAGATMEVNTYTGATSQKFNFVLLKSTKTAQTITFNSLPQKNRGDADFAPGASASSGLAVSYTSTNPAVATIVNGKVHIVGGGKTYIVASQAGNSTYDAAYDVPQLLTVSRLNQTITFPTFPTVHYRDADFPIGATVSSGLPLTYVSSNIAVATIVNGNIHVLTTGTTVISVSQLGDTLYNVAPQADQTLNVLKLDQTISFPILPTMKVGDADFAPGATASSGLTVTYKSSNTDVATIVSSKIHAVGAGTTLITASQSGDAKRYNAAPDSVQSLTILLANGINNLSESSIQIYPNPSKGIFTIDFTDDVPPNTAISITDLLGKEVYSDIKCSSKNKINLDHNPKGVYIVKIIYDGHLICGKILKE